MSGFQLQLPTIQNWNCHSCGGCCRQHGIAITEEEKRRIEQQNWTAADGIPADQPLFVKMGGLFEKTWHRLAHQPDGACVFLDEQGLCRIHGKFGEPAKPLACQIYPYAFHPNGTGVTVSLRFSCPSVVENKGGSVRSHKKEIRSIARQVVPAGVQRAKPPKISGRTQVDWPDFRRLVTALDETFAEEGRSIIQRLLQALAWVTVLEDATFDKVTGGRLDEFLTLIRQAAREQLPDNLSVLGEPSRMGRTQFRLLCAQYARKDTYVLAEGGWRQRWTFLRQAMRFAKGKGDAPPLQEGFEPVPFDQLETSFGPLSAEADEILTRYLRVKVQGIHFCGPAYYDVPFVEGFRSLALAYCAVLWIARWLAASDGRTTWTTEDIAQALAIADHHHGYSPAFGKPTFRRRVRILTQLGDVPKLVAWYG